MQHTVGEAAGGRADIQRRQPGKCKRRFPYRFLQFEATPAHVRASAFTNKDSPGIHKGGGLGFQPAVHPDVAGADLFLRPFPAGGEPPLHQQRVRRLRGLFMAFRLPHGLDHAVHIQTPSGGSRPETLQAGKTHR